MIITEDHHIEENLEQIWSNYSDIVKNLLGGRNYLYSKTLDTNSLLFIGMNPSYSKEMGDETSYDLNDKNNLKPYFKKFNEIAEECDNVSWTHLDLLFFRETDQRVIYKILKYENGSSFIQKQLELSDNLIKLSEPKAIVVCNALAGKFFGMEKDNMPCLGYDFPFDNEIGTCRWNKTPVFFSSMLTGQRALDNGSFRRLTWQINRTLRITYPKSN
jgi:hypothetical protein